MMIRIAIPSIALVLAMAGCTGAPPRDGGDSGPPAAQTPAPPPSGSGPSTGAAETDSARLARLELEARAMAQPGGCGEEGQCRTAPVGSRPCG
ncbi:MAG TPA: hypothetical protein VFR81_10515, partial [Longimicrobium sp.]|nr:hypothetical protein [Longimicrobium sp.]